MRKFFPVFILVFFLLFLAVSSNRSVVSGGTNSVYDDGLVNNWVSWSWGSNINFGNSSPVFSGAKSISFTPYQWGALYLHNDNYIDLTTIAKLKFTVFATSGNPKFRVLFYDSNNQSSNSQINLSDFGGELTIGNWKVYEIPTSSIPFKQIKGFALQESLGVNQPVVYIDAIELVPQTLPLPTVTDGGIYQDNLSTGWVNWSWGGGVDFNAVNNFSGSSSIAFSANFPWAGLYLHTDNSIDSSSFQILHFSMKASTNTQKYSIALYDANNQPLKSFAPLDSYAKLSANNWVTYNIPLIDLNAVSKPIKGLVIQESAGISQPVVFIDDIQLSTKNITPTPSLPPSLSPVPSLAPVNLTGFTTLNNVISKNGQAIKLKGVNWFGFETDTYVPHGLWVRNWKELIAQIKSIGFNAVRIPVCPATLRGVKVSPIDYYKNPDLVNLNSLQLLDKFLAEFNTQKIYFLLDHHRIDCQSISELWYNQNYSEENWVSDLKLMASRYKNLEYFLGLDPKNEPHGAATWGVGNIATDWNKAIEKAGVAILSANPNLLIFAEGVGENPVCSGSTAHFWGENLEAQKCHPISETFIPKGKLIFSPHIYGPDVNDQPYFNDPAFPDNMPAVWDAHYGYLLKSGYSIVPGEWGGKFGYNGGNQKDITLQNSLIKYLKNNGICSSFYWSFNPNSSDTGGILGDDWSTPWPNKVSALSDYYQNCR